MKFDITYDDHGKPVHVCTDDGFMQSSRPFNPDEDGWMLDQLDPRDFPEIATGHRVAALVAEVNELRRQLWSKDKTLGLYQDAYFGRGGAQ